MSSDRLQCCSYSMDGMTFRRLKQKTLLQDRTGSCCPAQRHDNHLTVQYSNLRSVSVFVVASMTAKFWKYVVSYTIKGFQNSSGRSCTSLRNVCMNNCQSICNSSYQRVAGSLTVDPYFYKYSIIDWNAENKYHQWLCIRYFIYFKIIYLSYHYLHLDLPEWNSLVPHSEIVPKIYYLKLFNTSLHLYTHFTFLLLKYNVSRGVAPKGGLPG